MDRIWEGKTVNHKTFGKGMIKIEEDNRFSVKYEISREDGTFVYPDSFGQGFLTAEDPELQKMAIEEWTEKENARKLDNKRKYEEISNNIEKTKKKGSSDEKKYVPKEHKDGNPLTFLVFQNKTFEDESKGQYVWAPNDDVFHHMALKNIREGDVILHCTGGYIKAISRAKNSCVDSQRPSDNEVYSEWSKMGHKVDCDYTILDKPIKTSDFHDSIIEYCQVKYAPFDKNGEGNEGYLFDIDQKLASIFIKAAFDLNENLAGLDYIQWFLK